MTPLSLHHAAALKPVFPPPCAALFPTRAAQGLTVEALRPREVLRRRRARRRQVDQHRSFVDAVRLSRSLAEAVITSATSSVSQSASDSISINAVVVPKSPDGVSAEYRGMDHAGEGSEGISLPPGPAASEVTDFEWLPLVASLDTFLESGGKRGLVEAAELPKPRLQSRRRSRHHIVPATGGGKSDVAWSQNAMGREGRQQGNAQCV